MNTIPFVDISRYLNAAKNEFLPLVDSILSTGQVISSLKTVEAEKKLNNFFNDQGDTCLVGSCSDALLIALMSLGVFPGDKIILPSYSFSSTLNAILVLGLTPIFVDVSEQGNGFDLDQLKSTVKKHSDAKAVVLVHLFGNEFPRKEIYNICEQYEITLVEDCAQWFCQPSVEFHELSLQCYSFDPTKNVYSIGSLGAIRFENNSFKKKIINLRSHGLGSLDGRYTYEGRGLNSRPSEINAAFLSFSLDQFQLRQKQRIKIANSYFESCEKSGVRFVGAKSSQSSTWNKFVIRTNNLDKAFQVAKSLLIQIRRHYEYTLPELCGLNHESYPVANNLKNTSVSLPIFPEMNAEEINRVCDYIKLIGEF